jgi:glycosyltransferase involved in cell wall biosynthesis
MIRPTKRESQLDELTRRELLVLARERGLKGYSRMKKAELVTRLAAYADREEPEERTAAPTAPPAMRVAVVAWEGDPSEPGGESGRHVADLARALAGSGVDVHLFVHATERPAGGDPFPVHRLAAGEGDLLAAVSGFGASVARALREEEERAGRPFDVLHVHDWTGAEALRELGDRAAGRTILTLHSIESERTAGRAWPMSAAIEAREQDAALRVDEVLVLSAAMKHRVADTYEIPDERVVWTRTPFPLERFAGRPADPGTIKGRYAVGPVDPMLLYLGPLDAHHGADVLLEAVPAVLADEPQARFVFVGDGGLAGDLLRRAADLGVLGEVRFLGHREGAEVEDLVRAADAVVVPSREPTDVGPVLCAWSAARPVVVTEEGPCAGIRDLQNGLRTRAEPAAVAEGIHRVFEDWDRARELGEHGLESLRRDHSWDAYANRVLEVYRA